jgi:hypothetical protein
MPLNDFNGDGRSDILWLSYLDGDYHGAVSNWLATPNGGFLVNDGNAFRWLTVWEPYRYMATGDFNGDGRSDVLHRSNSLPFEPPHYYSVDSGTPSGGWSSAGVGFAVNDTRWQVVGTGDFNGDGRDDLLWRHPDGTISNWLSDPVAGFIINDANALVHVPTNWQVVGTGDFNGDGHSDILWRSDTGWISNWLGTDDGGWVINDANALTHYGTDELHIGDFNSDGRDDLLLRSPQGAIHMSAAWEGGGFDLDWGPGFVANVPDAWRIVETGDYNGDGAADILWRHQSGAVSNWLGTGDGYSFNINDVNALFQVGTDWSTGGEALF